MQFQEILMQFRQRSSSGTWLTSKGFKNFTSMYQKIMKNVEGSISGVKQALEKQLTLDLYVKANSTSSKTINGGMAIPTRNML